MKHLFLTLYPELLTSYLDSFPFARLKESGRASFEVINLRDFAIGRNGQVDDKPYGGGEGMVLRPEPLAAAVEYLRSSHPGLKVLLTSARGKPWTDQLARKHAEDSHPWLIVCGRFSGIDQRFVDLYVDLELCIGPYVLAGGELPALVISESMVRHVSGALGHDESALRESFCDDFEGKCEYPLYTRPEVFKGQSVPSELIQGNHQKIERWRREHLL